MSDQTRTCLDKHQFWSENVRCLTIISSTVLYVPYVCNCYGNEFQKCMVDEIGNAVTSVFVQMVTSAVIIFCSTYQASS